MSATSSATVGPLSARDTHAFADFKNASRSTGGGPCVGDMAVVADNGFSLAEAVRLPASEAGFSTVVISALTSGFNFLG